MTMLWGVIAFISFLSFNTVWFGYNFVVNRWKSGSFPNTAVVLRKWRTWFGTAKLLILYLLSMHLYRNMSIYYIILHIMLYFILYIRTYIYTHTFLPLFMYCYFYYVHLFLENDSIFSNCFITYVFGIIG